MITALTTPTSVPASALTITMAVLAPEPIPVRWFTGVDPDLLAEPLSVATRAPLAFRHVLRAVSRYGLARFDPDRDELVVHRLTQAIVRDHTPVADRAAITVTVSALLSQLAPNDANNPAT
jgi:hypothetical protein